MEAVNVASATLDPKKAETYNGLVVLLGAEAGRARDGNTAEITFKALQAANRFFLPLVKQGAFRRMPEDPVQLKLRHWLKEKYAGYVDLLLTQLSHPEPGVQVPVLGWLMDVIVAESEYACKQAKAFSVATEVLERLVAALTQLPSKLLNDQLVGALADKHVNAHSDVRYYYLKGLAKVLETAQDERVLENAFVLLRDVVEMPTGEQGTEQRPARISYASASATTAKDAKHTKLSSLKKAFEDAWLVFLRRPLTQALYKRVLVILYKEIYPHLVTPALLMDFLADSFNAGGVASLLSLNCLYMLITKHNLDYPQFYDKLYSLFDESVMTVKYRARFFRMADVFLSSSLLPAYLVAAFVKRLARLSLVAPPQAILVNLVFLYNLLLRHPQCLVMIHRSATQVEKAVKDTDPYDSNEKAPVKSRALESSLWELLVLKDHYDPSVARLAATFEQPLRKVEYDLDEYLDKALFASEMKKTVRERPAMAFLVTAVTADAPTLFSLPSKRRRIEDDTNGASIASNTSDAAAAHSLYSELFDL